MTAGVPVALVARRRGGARDDAAVGSAVRRTAVAVATGAGIGLTNVAAFATADRGIGVTTAFESAAALAERRFAPEATKINRYLAERATPPKLGWEGWLVAGTVLGGFLDERLARRTGGAVQAGGGSRPALAAFTGGALAMFGARMADGCTSGHGLTGTAQLATSSWTFLPVMGASAAVVARGLRRIGTGATGSRGRA